MPVYEYEHEHKSSTCDAVFEVVQAMADQPFTVCPRCGDKVHRIISRANGFVPKLSAGRLRDLGFKRFVRRDRGVYERE